jgi:tetratricopeptide (TPR) repeat protein
METFRRHADNVLPFIDSYLEGGLKVIEDGLDESIAWASYRKGVEFAKIADRTFSEVVFSQYAASFASWSPEERKRFRMGQAEFRAGREKKDDPAEAIKHYRKSLSFAEPLNDAWGTAMAHFGIAQAELALGNQDKAREAAMKASEWNGRMRLRVAHIRSRLMCGQVYAATGAPASGRGHLRIAFEQLKPDDDPKLRSEVLDAYCVSLEAAGNPEMAQDLRDQFKGPESPAEAAEAAQN